MGYGHLYQGRFKSFPVQNDRQFLIVARHVERNALRAGLVERAERWKWSSLWRRAHPAADVKQAVVLSDWPVPRPADWVRWVNEPQTAAEVERLRRCIAKGQPFGDDRWEARTVKRLALQSSLRDRGRPKKAAGKAKP